VFSAAHGHVAGSGRKGNGRRHRGWREKNREERAMLKQITDELVADLDGLTFGPPVTHVYNPLVYAREAWDLYCEKYGQGRREILLVGMNPGPFGMAQVGVPFGDIALVREWLDIETPIGKPAREHPARPVQGFDCPRSEVSGRRLWSWAKDTFDTPEGFFSRFFVTNYCPLVFMEEGGRNRVPEKLPKAERALMYKACDRALRRTVESFEPEFVVGVGKFAEKKAREVVGDLDVIIGSLPHPSPASPLANRGWASLVRPALEAVGVRL
jgi:single-strand selective monofunctional uracil DNA glycosylase